MSNGYDLSIMSSNCKADISKVARDTCKVFINSTRKIFGVTKNIQVSENKPWFRRDCRSARKKFHSAKRFQNRYPTIENKINLSKTYKLTLDK